MQRHELLERVPLFRGLSEAARISLSQRLVERRFLGGELVFQKGDTGSAMFLVMSGKVEIFLPPEGGADRVDLKEVNEGEHFGELSLFDDKPRSASVEARTDCVLLELSREHFVSDIVQSEAAVLAILSEMAVRLRDTNALLSQRAARDVVKEFVEGRESVQVLRGISTEVSRDKLIISVAAGVPIQAIERRLHPPMRIVRAMPNTPATVGAAATALALGEHATDADLATARTIFDSVGLTVLLEESQLDAVTGLSGSGPAYLFLIIEALADAGVKVGLSRRASMQLAAQTVLGSAKLLIESGQHPGMLKDGVTSPGGTAIAGLHTLEAGGLRNVLMNAVEAATRRSRELGEEFLRKL